MSTRARRRCTAVVVAAAATALACGTGAPPDAPTAAPSTTTSALVATTSVDAPDPVGTQDPVEAAVVVVADPQPGDLRVDADADVLPASYRPAESDSMPALAYGPDPAQLIDVHLPVEPFDAPVGVVLYLHSGGWGAGGRAPVPPMVMRFVERGYAVASLEYRGAPEHPFPAAVEDVERAVRWLKADDLAAIIDGDRIVVYGASSGGLLAAMVGAAPGSFEPVDSAATSPPVDSSVAGVVSVAGPTDLVAMFDDPHPWAEGAIAAWLDCGPCDQARLAAASPVQHLSDDLPPAYWAYGALDPVVDATAQGSTMATAWASRAEPGTVHFDLVDGAGHNIDHTTVNQRAVEEFVDEVIGSG